MTTHILSIIALIVISLSESSIAWVSSPSSSLLLRNRRKALKVSSPWEADLYEPQEGQIVNELIPSNARLVIGVNKYTHDTSVCVADAETGQVYYATAKERLDRRKHSAGNIVDCLEILEDTAQVETVVVNNHHHRVLPLETSREQLEWEIGLNMNGRTDEDLDDLNLLPNARHHELSHHLAHAYSTATQAPFDEGVVIVMDGMGETLRTMLQHDKDYTSDFALSENIQLQPSNLMKIMKTSRFDWREAESVYQFQKTETSLEIKPLFKRFTPEQSPPALDNHGFENMDSVGAVYSRASSHIFGDWNACGKVMGLAPWACHEWGERKPVEYLNPILQGRIQDGSLQIDRTLLQGLPLVARDAIFDSEGNRKKPYDFDDSEEAENNEQRLPSEVALEAIGLASRIQTDLETVVLDFVIHFQRQTKATNLCLAGGVALNSVLNGRLAREVGFVETFISPYPGDDGIAFGCCAFGLNALTKPRPPTWSAPLTPYLGANPSETEINQAIEDSAPWLEVEAIRSDKERIKIMVQEIASGGVIAWYQSRSEMGPRALGHRSILADPRKKGLVRFINEHVKSRESFRPFAPSALQDEAHEWFDLQGSTSPYMSMTAMVHQDKRDQIPAVTHVDGSSRLQTVTAESEPLYYSLIRTFFELTGVPMVLNTSFNTLPSEPIVESPIDAIRSFLYSMGSIEMLVLGDYVIRRKPPNVEKLLGQVDKSGDLQSEPACPIRAGPVMFRASFSLNDNDDEEEPQVETLVRMPKRPIHHSKQEWFTLLDELEGELLSVCDGQHTVNDIIPQYTETLEEGESMTPEMADEAQSLAQNIVHRLVRLYEHTFISW